MSSQRVGKYACLEIERRYWLAQPPPDLVDRLNYWQIVDRYLTGTRLRLRKMTPSSGEAGIFKLTQKFGHPSQNETQTIITNIYLDEAEYRRLETLEAGEIVKNRYEHEYKGRRYSIDLFKGPLQGLILAETEAETEAELSHLSLPSFVAQDVTADPFFTGGSLVTLSQAQLRRGLIDRFGSRFE